MTDLSEAILSFAEQIKTYALMNEKLNEKITALEERVEEIYGERTSVTRGLIEDQINNEERFLKLEGITDRLLINIQDLNSRLTYVENKQLFSKEQIAEKMKEYADIIDEEGACMLLRNEVKFKKLMGINKVEEEEKRENENQS